MRAHDLWLGELLINLAHQVAKQPLRGSESSCRNVASRTVRHERASCTLRVTVLQLDQVAWPGEMEQPGAWVQTLVSGFGIIFSRCLPYANRDPAMPVVNGTLIA